MGSEIIMKSFKSCVLNLVTDGIEDGQICCFKMTHHFRLVLLLLKQATKALDEAQASSWRCLQSCENSHMNKEYDEDNVIDIL